MKTKLFLFILFSGMVAVCQEAPPQIAPWASCIDKRTILKAIGDPVCAPAAAIAFCTYNVCNLPYPYACALGASSSCLGVYLATDADESKFDYYSVRAMAALKQGWYCLFPCMKDSVSVTKKTE